MSVADSRQADSPFSASARPSGQRGGHAACRFAAAARPLACAAGLALVFAAPFAAYATERHPTTKSHHTATAPRHSAAPTHTSRRNTTRHAAAAAAPTRHASHALASGHDRDASRAHADSGLKLPSGALPVHDAVSTCVASLNRDMRSNKRYDRLIQLDRYVIRARVQHDAVVFSEGQPVPVDTTVMIKGSARVRGHWQWQSVITRCGLHHGKVVATSIEPRTIPAPLPPGEERERRPGVDYVERAEARTRLA